jgi:hypothetical protein
MNTWLPSSDPDPDAARYRDHRRLKTSRKVGIECLTATLADGADDFERIEQSRILAERHFELRRIRAARFNVFSTISDLENANLDDFETALRAMGSISRYDTRAFSRSKRALRKSNG